MDRLTQDGTAEPVSRDQVLRREQRGQGNISAAADWESTRIIANPARDQLNTKKKRFLSPFTPENLTVHRHRASSP